MANLESRLARLERRVGVAEGQRRAYSHAQLVVMVAYLNEHDDQEPENWADVVGIPSDVLGPGQKSHCDLVMESVLRFGGVAGAASSPAEAAEQEPVAPPAPDRAADQT